MFISDLAPVIFVRGTSEKKRPIKVVEHLEPHRVIWEGPAYLLERQKNLGGFEVVSVLPDKDTRDWDAELNQNAEWNWGKIVTVI